jgi:hypothetical protein
MGGGGVGVGRPEDSKDKDTIKKGYNAASYSDKYE